MSRLKAAGLVDVTWSEDEDGNVFAEGLQEYEITANYELAVFQGDSCVKVQQCEDLTHAAAVVYAHEGICRWNIKEGKTWRGHDVNEKGWTVRK